jgi:RNA polymerase sigma-70 factor (ECF subfamily)
MSDIHTATSNHRLFMGYFLKSAPAIKAFLLSAVRDPHDADDLFQEVSSVLWEKFSSFKVDSSFAGWALGVARLEVLVWRRKQAQTHKQLSEEALKGLAVAAEETAEWDQERRGHLQECIRKLPANVNRVIRLRYEDSMNIDSIAARLRKSIPAIEMILVRARRMLRDCIVRHQAGEAAQ